MKPYSQELISKVFSRKSLNLREMPKTLLEGTHQIRFAIQRKAIETEIKNNEFLKVIMPEENDLCFDDLLDLTEQKLELNSITKYIKNNCHIEGEFIPVSNFFFFGPSGSGKKSLAIAFAHEVNLPIVIVKFHAIYTKPIDELNAIFKRIYRICNKFENCILFIDELTYLGVESETVDSFSIANLLVSNIRRNPKIITFASCSVNVQLPKFIFDEGVFEKRINFICPELKIREEFFRRFCNKYPHEDNINFNAIAKSIYDVTGGDIKKIIKSSMQYVLNSGREVITEDDIEEVISLSLYGEKRKQTTEKERKLTAYHEAGHAVAGYFSGVTNISKVDIIHREESLGLTISTIDEEKYSWTREDIENQIILALGGYAAEMIIIGSNTSGVAQDLYSATALCISMINSYGMNDEFGPICTAFEEKVEFPELDKISDLILQKKMKEYLDRATKIVESHRKELDILATALIEKEVVLYDEMVTLFDSLKEE